ncbi:MFS transporter [Saccharothrix australiensis]|uniref:MFS transporter n=1 Tax=Saccharothrix australiensis TaxID=2072 RepID=UPI00319DF72B
MGPLSSRAVLPLYAAGFVTAFGAHGIASGLGGYTGASLPALGVLLAVYDGAEIVLKPVFGSLADRIGPRPVLLGGLVAFALASAAFVLADDPGAVGVVRLAQGAAAAAFSPAASALVARLTPAGGHGRAFGGYGAWKGLGYTLGPLIGGALIAAGGFGLLFTALAVLAVAVAVWAALVVPAAPPLPRTRQTLLDLGRELARPGFLRPTAALAATTAGLAVGVGFLPVHAADAGPLVAGVAVSAMAAAAALAQPVVGRARDAGRLRDTTGMTGGLLLTAAGYLVAATLPGLPATFAAAVAIGVGAGLVTPLGFAALAAAAPPERLGRFMGSAEVGRELGDAGGPLLVGGIAVVTTLGGGLLGLAAVLTLTATATGLTATRRRGDRS